MGGGAAMPGLSVWEVCLLGVVQGLTEFLPVSSDGHLALVHRFLTPVAASQQLAIDVALHLGTLVAVLTYFARDLWTMAAAMLGRSSETWARAWVGLIALGTLPAAIAGFGLRHSVEAAGQSLPMIGGSFLVTGTLLWLGSAVRGATRDEGALGRGDALVIGCFQALALLPGVSRSGTTIAAALFRRVRPDVAARFSFLLAIPAVAGALVLELPEMAGFGPELHAPLVVGVLTAGATGLAAIAFLLRLVRGGKLHWFAYYCWVLGSAVLVAAAFGRSGA